MSAPILLDIIRIFIGILLALSAYAKLAQPFASQLRDVKGYELTGPRASEAMVVFLPPLQLFLVCFLTMGPWVQFASVATALLILVHAGVVYSVIHRNITTECGIFGKIARPKVGVPLLVADLVAVAVLIAGAMATPRVLIFDQYQTGALIVIVVAVFINIAWQMSSRKEMLRSVVSSH